MSKLETTNTTLKVRTLADADALFELLGDKAVMQHAGGPVADRDIVVKSVFTSDMLWRKTGLGHWSVFSNKSNDLIGTVSLVKTPNGTEFSIFLNKKSWKKGLGFEISQKVLEFGFGLHKLKEVFASLNPENTAGLALFKKLGFTEVPGGTDPKQPRFRLTNPK